MTTQLQLVVVVVVVVVVVLVAVAVLVVIHGYQSQLTYIQLQLLSFTAHISSYNCSVTTHVYKYIINSHNPVFSCNRYPSQTKHPST
jgi:ABC-type lipoprotein release transport system permease subunit